MTLWYSIGMVAVSIIFVVLAFIGPVAQSIASRADKLIDASLPTIVNSINDYVDSEHKLPVDLSSLDLDKEAQQIVQKGLVKYQDDGLNTGKDSLYSIRYNYQLCVTYTQKSPVSSYSTYIPKQTDSYKAYISTYDHPAGEVCYKLYATYYDYTL